MEIVVKKNDKLYEIFKDRLEKQAWTVLFVFCLKIQLYLNFCAFFFFIIV
jgi:hypothetical protein